MNGLIRLYRLATPVVGGLLAVLATATLVTGAGVTSLAEAVQWITLGVAGVLWLATVFWRDDPEAWGLAFGLGLAFGGVGYAIPWVAAVLGGTTGAGWAFVQVVVGVAIVLWGLRYATLGMGRIAAPEEGGNEGE